MHRLLIVILGLLAAAQCAARAPVVRVGLPQSYEAIQRKLAAERCSDKASVCYRYALGSEYQLLDWLQTGRIDAAAVSGLTLVVMQRAVGDKFDEEFLVTTGLPQSELTPRRYRVVLRGERDGAALQSPDAELDRLLRDMIAGQLSKAIVDLPSHLSAGVPELHARVRGWLKRTEGGTSEERGLDAVMEHLVGRLRFADGKAAPELRLIVSEEEGGPLSHLFLVRKLALTQPLAPGARVAPALEAERAFLDYLDGARKRAAPESELGRFAAGNYRRESAGWRTRFRFAFSLDELHGILRSHARDAEEDRGIALVLTGGGVKAAYQTKLIDHLYGPGGYLHNRLAPGAPKAHSVPVNYVVGTSGGALLGVFVASLDGRSADPELSTKLWYRHKNGAPTKKMLSATNVFPWADLMRWASVLFCAVIFGAVCAATAFIRRWRGAAMQGPRDEAGRFWRFTVWWLALLGVTPWLLVYLNGVHGAEHIPAIQGAFYGLFVLIAIYSDNRLVIRKEARTDIASARKPLAVMAAGVALVVAALFLARGQKAPIEALGSSITTPALVACFGALLAFWGLHRWFLRCAPWLEPVKSRALPVMLLIIGVFIVSHGALCVLAFFGYASTFELVLAEFWGVLGAIVLVVSIVLACLAYSGAAPWLQRLFDFLLSPHPSPGMVTLARGTRMIACAVAAWVWWNLLVAPGLYGNQDALGYFRQAAINVFGPAALGGGSVPTLKVTFHAHYVAPVTALQKGAEHYVMFRPAQAYASSASGAGLGSRSWVTISNDPRWLTVEDEAQQARLVMRVAFASGSPFPVFPAHRIELPVVGEQLLVDGGYAHNVPVEAAKRLGARRVLVISSSPREPGAQPSAKAPEEETDFQYVGNFALLLRWVLPYLYQRSQVEDALSGEDLLVASIAPSARAKGWPFLTDFRANVVKRMFEEAEKDQTLRIGSIENWGQPSFAARPTSGTLARGSPEP